MPKDSNIRASSRDSRIMNANKWLTLDRKWNIFFFIAISLGLIIGWHFTMHMNLPYTGIFITISTAILTSLICMFFNGTKFIRKNRVLNSEGNVLTKNQLPAEGVMTWYFVANFLVAWLWLSPGILYFLILFSILCLYFVYKNCPITYIFNSKIHCYKTESDESFRERMLNYSQQRNREYICRKRLSPAYSHLPQNRYHSSYTRHR